MKLIKILFVCMLVLGAICGCEKVSDDGTISAPMKDRV
jgi:hypothetical protein